MQFYTFLSFSAKSSFEHGLVNHALCAAMRTLLKVICSVLEHYTCSFHFHAYYKLAFHQVLNMFFNCDL